MRSLNFIIAFSPIDIHYTTSCVVSGLILSSGYKYIVALASVIVIISEIIWQIECVITSATPTSLNGETATDGYSVVSISGPEIHPVCKCICSSWDDDNIIVTM